MAYPTYDNDDLYANKICPTCGTSNDTDSLFCIGCGQKLNGTVPTPDVFPPVGGGITCPKCGTGNDSDSIFCIGCGCKLSSAASTSDVFPTIGDGITCPNCGAGNDSDSLFCIECGKKLNDNISNNFINDDLERCPNCGSIIDPLTDMCSVCHYNKNDLKEYAKDNYHKADEISGSVTSTVKTNTPKIEITEEIKEANSNFKPASSFDD